MSEVCRTCLAYGRLQPIFHHESGAIQYADLILRYSGVKIEKDDGYPQSICLACIHLVRSAAYFYKIARESDEKLRSGKSFKIHQVSDKDVKQDPHHNSLSKLEFETRDYTCQGLEDSDSDSTSTDKQNQEQSESDEEEKSLIELARIKRRVTEDAEKTSAMCSDEEPKYDDQWKKISVKTEELNHWDGEKSSGLPSSKKNKLFYSKITKTYAGYGGTKLNKEGENILVKAEDQTDRRGDKEWSARVRATFLISSAPLKIECRVCGQILKQRASMNGHAQKHLGFRVICEACGKGFPNNSTLQSHRMNRHGMKKPFTCSKCPFNTSVKFELKVHERKHTGERPFVCDTCGSSFQRRRCFVIHTQSHSQLKPYKCTSCDKCFVTSGDMKAHHNAIHQRRYVFPCPVCGHTYARRTTVYKHVAAQHEVTLDKKKFVKILL